MVKVKTMSKYSLEEQRSMVGMWCEAHVAGKKLLEVIGAVEDGRVILVDPNGGRTYQLESLNPIDVVPRFDLPRAWTTGGQPCGE